MGEKQQPQQFHPQQKPNQAPIGSPNASQGDIDVLNPPAKNSQPTENVPKTAKKSKKSLVTLLVVLVLALGAAAAYYMFVYKKPKSNPQPAVDAKKDVETITYEAFSGGFDQFYPDVEAPGDVVSQIYNTQIFEGLVGREGQTKIVPLLATGWSNPDDVTWLFTLKDNVKFHNGNTLGADDVKYSLETISKKEAYSTYTSTIKAVETPASNQVKVTTTVADPLFLNKLTFLYIIDAQATDKTNVERATGPYQIKTGSVPTADKAELVAYDSYHGGHVYTRALNFAFNSQTEDPDEAEAMAVQSVASHDTNIAGFIGATQLAKAKEMSLQTFINDDLSVRFVGFNAKKTKSPVSKQKVRQAIYLAIDADAIIKLLGEDENAKPATQVLTQQVPGYNADITRPARNVDQAKQLLSEAGYPKGTTITLTVGAPAKNVGEELARQLKEAGITVKLDVRDDAQQFFSDISEAKAESWYVGDSSELLDGNFLYQRLFKTDYYNNPAITAQIDQADQTIDETKRLDTVKTISKALMDDVAVAPIYTRKSVWVMDKDYQMSADLPDMDIGVYFWKVHLK